ncbi:MAG: SCO6745 family protein [Acidimicrobiales bacterium]
MNPEMARKTWRTVEPLHGMIYFVPEAAEEYAAAGLEPNMGYFASRSAAMGPVGAGVVVATFFNFDPRLVEAALPAAWERATPAAVLAARLRAADRALRRLLGAAAGSAEMEEAAALARTAAWVAAERPQGRALFAAHAGLEWPEAPHLVLWHAQTLLREYRGDAHVALLTAAGLSPVEALVIHAASGEVPAAALRATRAWSDVDWEAGVESVRSRGWLEPGPDLGLSEAGRAHRRDIEDRTDPLSLAPAAARGEQSCERLRQLTRPMSRAVVDSGALATMSTRPVQS